jgi:hypothetical protein
MTNIAKSEFNEALKLLEEVYRELYIQSYYDPDSQTIQKFCIPLEEKMSQANEILRFKK